MLIWRLKNFDAQGTERIRMRPACLPAGAIKGKSRYKSRGNKISIFPDKIQKPGPKICIRTPTFAVLSQTVESGVSAGELNTPFLHGHFLKGKNQDYAR